ncbi:site-specific integrase [Burkholderia lata]|uniref:site-specific integrase n=1 Tax=Burkholderia lata (strain ATCC 17760 / DSM 23089 / LMG 22485 / NCIMB 9086 / R18194 / 383) TaxID=482957 RepID=UPI000A8007BE|nr:site-specific integrase [Burkholderia lata]
MTGYAIREVRLESGERVPVLVHGGPSGLPVPGILEYSLTKLRARGLRRASIRHRVEALGLTLPFLSDRRIDLVSRANDQIFLSLNELVALADLCRTPKRKRATKLVVGSAYAAVRYATAIDYMLWVFEPVIFRMSAATARHAANLALQRFLTRARSVSPRARGQNSHIDGERRGLHDDQRALFLKVIRPDYPGNPFDARTRARNHALLLVAFKLGARSGEIRGLKKTDLNLDSVPAELTILPRYHDADDKRMDPAAAKTLGRLLYIDSELADALERWLAERSNRVSWPRAHRNPYVFVNRYGDAMEGRGYRKIIETLRRRYPELGALCHHVLRHDWNDRWVAMTEQDDVDFEKAQHEQKYAMGWSHQSNMPLRYGRQAIASAANRRILNLQHRLEDNDE